MLALVYSLNFEQFSQASQKGNLVPLYREIPADLDTPVSAFLKIQTGKGDFLLESVEGGEKWGRYSFLGTQPAATFTSRGKTATLKAGTKSKKISITSDPLAALKDYLAQFKPVEAAGLPRFFGGCVGYMAYDLVRFFEKIPDTAADDLKIPDCTFLITDTVIIFDNLKQVIKVVANIHVDSPKNLKKRYADAVKKIDKLVAKLQKPLSLPKKLTSAANLKPVELKPSRTEEEFCALVEQAKEYIRAGDIFQVQISTRFEAKSNIPPFALYRSIRRLNPSPYLYFLQLDDLALVGASPEVMVRVEDSHVELRPIAGTRRRGRDAADDHRMEEELRSDPKERAEHVMLVDLGRNDLGRVCKTGTVRVKEQEVVERYSHVMHLVSHVEGDLGDGKDAFDVIRATFPAGTLTGAPKIRSMEIIEELEGVRRGVYGGAVGYIGFSGNLDMAITIRTALFHKGKIRVQAAGGIVYDSVPRLEYKECQNKARAMMKALQEL